MAVAIAWNSRTGREKYIAGLNICVDLNGAFASVREQVVQYTAVQTGLSHEAFFHDDNIFGTITELDVITGFNSQISFASQRTLGPYIITGFN